LDYSQVIFYIQQLQQQVQLLNLKINSLETRIQQCELMDHSPKTNIEKLEYHFDQLKIEHLDGTLHIGVTPEDLTKTDDFSLPLPQHPSASLYQELQQAFDYNLPPYIQTLESDYDFQLTDAYRQTLLQDMRKQLPNRLTHYMQKDKKPTDEIIPKILHDCKEGLIRWFEQQKKE
jgi:spore germination protein PC